MHLSWLQTLLLLFQQNLLHGGHSIPLAPDGARHIALWKNNNKAPNRSVASALQKGVY